MAVIAQPTGTPWDRLQARAAAARQAAGDLRRDALAERWRASGIALVYEESRISFSWSMYRTHLLRRDVHRTKAVDLCVPPVRLDPAIRR
jgi:hypothetical protein